MPESIHTPESIKEFPLAVVKNMIMLSTSGFGVVVGLAWNEAIKSVVTEYIDPLLGKNSGVVSLFIYAAIMTFLAVMVTMQLGKLQKQLETIEENLKSRKNNTLPPKKKKK